MAPRQTVLVVEDDDAIREGVVDALEYRGFAVLEAADGEAGLELALRSEIDLLLLDVVMPGRTGLEILVEVRRSRPTLPVILLTARGRESERVEGLEKGADDYIVKPFSIKELAARIKAVLRRSPGRQPESVALAFPGLEIDLERRELRFSDGESGELSEKEVELLRYLAARPGRAVSRDELLSNVWRLDPRGIRHTRAIDMHIARLRDKLRDREKPPKLLQTVRGKGYRLGTAEPAGDAAGGPG